MKKLLFVIPLITLLTACGPTKVADEAGTCHPSDLQVEPGDQQLTIRWKSNCGQLISGYDIYVQRQPIMSRSSSNPYSGVSAHNQVPYPGDTNPDDEFITYEAKGLENGVKYWVSVCAVYSDRTLSSPTKEIMTACGPRGQIELSVRYAGEHDGYSFSQDRYVEADELSNDLYYFNQNGADYIDAPTHLDGFLRKTRFVKLEVQSDLGEAIAYVDSNNPVPDQDRVAIKKGDWLLVKTNDNNFVLVKVLSFLGNGDKRQVKLFFAYSSIPNQLVL